MHSFFLFRVNWMKWTRVCSNARLRKKEKSFVRRCARSLIHSIKWNRGHGQQRKIKHKFRNSIKMLFTEKWTAIKMYSVVFRENTLDIRMPPIPLAVVILSPPLPSRIIYTMPNTIIFVAWYTTSLIWLTVPFDHRSIGVRFNMELAMARSWFRKSHVWFSIQISHIFKRLSWNLKSIYQSIRLKCVCSMDQPMQPIWIQTFRNVRIFQGEVNVHRRNH